ncbi:hypothetical protein M0R19_04780 [Candidatus Pacearchaeota archaeon]|jgi:hypothetical protein|nr:hypothetical protein [Candidatus Pacearchaeota archaeon]
MPRGRPKNKIENTPIIEKKETKPILNKTVKTKEISTETIVKDKVIDTKKVPLITKIKKCFLSYKKKLKNHFNTYPQKWTWFGLTIFVLLLLTWAFLYIIMPYIFFKADTDRYYTTKVNIAYETRKAELENDTEKIRLQDRVSKLEQEKFELESIIKVKDLEIENLKKMIKVKETEIYTMILLTSELLKSVGSDNYFYENNGKIHFSGDTNNVSGGMGGK